MKKRFRTGGLAAWSIHRPVSVTMLALSIVVLGFFSLDRLSIDLLPHIIYPEIRVVVRQPGVPAVIMEDQVTRQLEEQLAITEGAISVQSSTSEGESRIYISFPYGTDIDLALRDASSRLDRAKRFLPDGIDPPIIYKRDPSQIPVIELAVGSNTLDPVRLREWVDYNFSRWFVNLPGVAAAEIGGGNKREIQIIIDQERLASFGYSFNELGNIIRNNNIEMPGGRLLTKNREISVRAFARFNSVDEIKRLPLWNSNNSNSKIIRLSDVSRVIDLYEDERLRVRLNKNPSIKLSIQKQPQANTVTVVDTINQRLEWLRTEKLIPDDIKIGTIDDQSTFIRYALRNAGLAAFSGALLAMIVVYAFLGDLRRTLIIGTAIPMAILVTFIIMSLGNLTLNIMTLGGIALGVGLLIDSTIIMLENITRHQLAEEQPISASITAATEINSAIVASTSTNLAAILPFLFISGIIGLLFSDLIFTLTAAITASLLVALTIVPSLGARVINTKITTSKITQIIDRILLYLNLLLIKIVSKVLHLSWKPFLLLIPLWIIAVIYIFVFSKETFLPQIDEGEMKLYVHADTGTQFNSMDEVATILENMLLAQPEIKDVFTTSGGSVYGRTERLTSNSSSFIITLYPQYKSSTWINIINNKISELNLVGITTYVRNRGVRGIRIGHGDDDISIRVMGNDINKLEKIGADIVARTKNIKGLRNLSQTYEEVREEISVNIDNERAANLGITTTAIGDALQVALEGKVVSTFLEGDRAHNIRIRLPANSITTRDDLNNILVGFKNEKPIRLIEVASPTFTQSPQFIKRDNQRRIVEVSASLTAHADLKNIIYEIESKLSNLPLPDGYALYDGGATKTLQDSQRTGIILIALAIFLVYVVMAIQYESFLNPLIILFSLPFGLIGVALGLWLSDLPGGLIISMPVKLGIIMLAGIVVNNAIVLVEQIEIQRESGQSIEQAIFNAVKLRLRPILMTTLTTVFGMMPLALGLGRGSEMLQPLAIVIVWGLFFSMLVSLIIVPSLYKLLHPSEQIS